MDKISLTSIINHSNPWASRKQNDSSIFLTLTAMTKTVKLLRSWHRVALCGRRKRSMQPIKQWKSIWETWTGHTCQEAEIPSTGFDAKSIFLMQSLKRYPARNENKCILRENWCDSAQTNRSKLVKKKYFNPLITSY